MKVVYGIFCQPEMGGGVGRVGYELADFITRGNSTQVLVVRPGKTTKIKKIRPNYSQLVIESTQEGEVVIPDFSPKNVKFVFESLKKFSPQIIHLHDFGPIAFLIQVWALINKVPVILTVHLLPGKAMAFGASEVLQKLTPFLESRILKNYLYSFFTNCRAVIALNPRVKKEVEKFGYQGKVLVIANGRDLSLYKKPKPCFNFQKKKRLIFTGHLTQRKNQKYLLKVMKYLPKEFELDLLGEALGPRYRQELEAMIKKMNLSQVRLLGKINHSLIPQYLRQSLVFVSASKMEAQSLAVIEALASGTPVVGLSNETIDELVDGSVGDNLPKTASPREFAQKILKISQLPLKEYQKLSQRCREKVFHLNWPEIVEKTIRAYQAVIEDYQPDSRKKPLILAELEKISPFLEEEGILKAKEKIEGLEQKLSWWFNRNRFYFGIMIIIVYASESILSFSQKIRKLKKNLKFPIPARLEKLKKELFEEFD